MSTTKFDVQCSICCETADLRTITSFKAKKICPYCMNEALNQYLKKHEENQIEKKRKMSPKKVETPSVVESLMKSCDVCLKESNQEKQIEDEESGICGPPGFCCDSCIGKGWRSISGKGRKPYLQHKERMITSCIDSRPNEERYMRPEDLQYLKENT